MDRSRSLVEMEEAYSELLNQIGVDTSCKSLEKTPLRAAHAFSKITEGYQVDIAQLINGALFPAPNENMVVVQDIEFYSLCEHHLLPFFGKCHVAYIPYQRIIGLSKIPRIVDAFSKRLQVQESLTQEIADAILEHTNAKGVGVIMEGKHLCTMMRGVEKQLCKMKTSCMLGFFEENAEVRQDFYTLISD